MSTVLEDAPVVAPTEDPLDKAISEAIAKIKSVYDLLPDFQPAPVEGMRRERPSFSVPDAFLEAAVVAKESNPSLQVPLDPARVREVIRRGLRLEAIAMAAEALARDVRYNIFRERWSAVEDSLQIYDLAKAYVRRPQGASLVAHVKSMREALGRSGGHRAKTKTAPKA